MNLLKNTLFKKSVNSTLLERNNFINSSVRCAYNAFHQLHILNANPWPLSMAGSLFATAIGLVIFLHFKDVTLVLLGLLQLLITTYFWFYDIIDESLEHTPEIRAGLRLGMLLFIVSEVLFFFSFFLAFFYLSLSPAVELGISWPPIGLNKTTINYLSVPLINTLILIFSGLVITCAHEYLEFSFINFKNKLFEASLFYNFILSKFYSKCKASAFTETLTSSLIGRVFLKSKFLATVLLFLTIILALLFTSFQIFEYLDSLFLISDGAYGTTFFLLTGFHGFHVLVGSVMLFVCFLRLCFGHFDDTNYIGLECAIWYWHFVDVVWIFLYIFVYGWGSLLRTGGLFVNEKPLFFEIITNTEFWYSVVPNYFFQILMFIIIFYCLYYSRR